MKKYGIVSTYSLTFVSQKILACLHTGGIERFSARKNFSKLLQVSHFHLGFSPGKNNNEIIHFHRVLLGILDPDLENTNKTL